MTVAALLGMVVDLSHTIEAQELKKKRVTQVASCLSLPSFLLYLPRAFSIGTVRTCADTPAQQRQFARPSIMPTHQTQDLGVLGDFSWPG